MVVCFNYDILNIMGTRGRRILFLTTLLFVVGNVHAADEWGEKKTKGGTIRYKKRTEYEFQGLELEGKLKSPSGALVSPRRKVRPDSLIKLRTDFDNEVDASLAGTR